MHPEKLLANLTKIPETKSKSLDDTAASNWHLLRFSSILHLVYSGNRFKNFMLDCTRKLVYISCSSGQLCSTDTDRRISIGPIRIRGYVKFLQNLKAQRCIGVSDTDTRIRIGYVIRGHVEVSGLQSHWLHLIQQLASGCSQFILLCYKVNFGAAKECIINFLWITYRFDNATTKLQI